MNVQEATTRRLPDLKERHLPENCRETINTILADKAYGTNEILDYIQQQDGDYAIPPKSNTRNPWRCDWALYKERHLVECFFLKLKQFRRVATRYDKLASSFLAFVYLASIAILLK